MSDFLLAMVPLLVFWAIPLVPFAWAVVAELFDAVSKPVRRDEQMATKAAPAVLKTSSFDAGHEPIEATELSA